MTDHRRRALVVTLIWLATGCATPPNGYRERVPEAERFLAPLGGADAAITSIHTVPLSGDPPYGFPNVGTTTRWPSELSRAYEPEIRAAQRYYAAEDYGEAVKALQPVRDGEPDNPFFLYLAARSLFFLEDARDASLAYFTALEQVLGERYALEPNQAWIDGWFPDLPWKLAALYLDRRQWNRALRYLALSAPWIVYERESHPHIYRQLVLFKLEAYHALGLRDPFDYFHDLVVTELDDAAEAHARHLANGFEPARGDD